MLVSPPQPASTSELCRHCGDPCDAEAVRTADGAFCCRGCETVFTLLQTAGLDAFYGCEVVPGTSQKRSSGLDRDRFAVLDDPTVASRLVTFDDGVAARATLSVPAIHCASCVWLLEQLWRFDDGVTRSEVDLLRRSVRVEYRPASTTLRRIAERIASLGYEPVVSPEDRAPRPPAGRRRLHLQIGVAGFAFGNIMLFSIPRYVNGVPLEGGFQRLFDVLNILFAVPVLLFSAQDYFRTAWQVIRRRSMALEVPVALGLAVLFVRSVVDIGTGHSEGFLDSFAGLVFFLLLGRLFQQKVFDRIAFDRTFRSFLPLSVRAERTGGVELVPLERLATGDVIQIRRSEVVPADAELLDATGSIDYAFITGEQRPVSLAAGDIVRAGGRAADRAMRLRVVRDVSHSHLASLWNNPVFAKPKSPWLTDVAARFGAWFTFGAIAIALAGAIAWWPDASTAASVATAVLIIACPCALTLAAPITLGTAMGQLGLRGLYLKHPAVALDLSRVDLIIFDKTGTLTGGSERTVDEASPLSRRAWSLIRTLASHSLHPVSRAIASISTADAAPYHIVSLDKLVEVPGEGISAQINGVEVAIGGADFAGKPDDKLGQDAGLTFVRAGHERGWVRLSPAIRAGAETAARVLSKAYQLFLLSGDSDSERLRWAPTFGEKMRFRQTPQDKLAFVAGARAAGHHVLMIGDGLNDAGALAAADVGISVSDETACIVPACDAVISGTHLEELPAFIAYASRSRTVVIICLLVSLLYNVLGLSLALAGRLTPLASAILMPVSSLTIVALSSGAMRWSARQLLPSAELRRPVGRTLDAGCLTELRTGPR
jgi:Cu+-exporting ATPase